jgi:hypothetical protein
MSLLPRATLHSDSEQLPPPEYDRFLNPGGHADLSQPP